MRLSVVELKPTHVEPVLALLRQTPILDALGLERCPSAADLLSGEAWTKFDGQACLQQVRWWIIEADGSPRWGAIEYGWRGALDSSRELDLFRLTDASALQDDILWGLWLLVRAVMQRRQSRRVRWQVSKEQGKGSIYRRLGVHPLGEFELEGGTREVFELSRKRFERVEEALGSGEGRGRLLAAWRATVN